MTSAPAMRRPRAAPTGGGRHRAAWVSSAMVALSALLGCGAAVDNAALDSAYHDQRAAEVTVMATVTALLADSPPLRDGAHQRFDVNVDGITIEVDHNLSLAPRVPLAVGDSVTIHGQFEPDPGHPVIHYTHHATGAHEGGSIELNGTTYQ